MEKVIGNCGKHPGQNMVNCPLCEIEAMEKESSAQHRGCGRWVSLENKNNYPTIFKKVFVLSKLGQVAISCVDASKKFDTYPLFKENDVITHWMPIPSNDSSPCECQQLREALDGLVKDIRSKPNNTRYATYLKIADAALASVSDTPKTDNQIYLLYYETGFT